MGAPIGQTHNNISCRALQEVFAFQGEKSYKRVWKTAIKRGSAMPERDAKGRFVKGGYQVVTSYPQTVIELPEISAKTQALLDRLAVAWERSNKRQSWLKSLFGIRR